MNKEINEMKVTEKKEPKQTRLETFKEVCHKWELKVSIEELKVSGTFSERPFLSRKPHIFISIIRRLLKVVFGIIPILQVRNEEKI
jgi:hypothetical protein